MFKAKSTPKVMSGRCLNYMYMSRRMGKPTICIGENKGADQLRSTCEADRRLCFRCTDSIILLLPKSEISSFYPASVTVQAGLCQTLSEPKLLVFSRTSSYLTSTQHSGVPTYGTFCPYVDVRCIRSAWVLHKLRVRYNTLAYVVGRRVRA